MGNVPLLDRPMSGFVEESTTGKVSAHLLPSTIKNENGGFLTKYQAEKITGRRRSTGQLKLKRLTAKHLMIIAFHLQNMSGSAIANAIGCSEVKVSHVINDPLAREVIDGHLQLLKMEINALAKPAVQAVREGLEANQSLTNKFRAISMLKIVKEITGAEQQTQTAEDLVEALLSKGINIQTNVQVNVNKE